MGNLFILRLIHFSACGASPDGISRRLRTKWQGEQEVLKYYPEASIIRPTSIIGNSVAENFMGQYII
jgi:NADH dehydrogenase (ubiquinone) 1 alpha subcomplex subunit 9